MIKVQVPGKFYYDWSGTAESHIMDAERDCAHPQAVSTITKLDNAKHIKRGKGFYLIVELTTDEAQFLKEEAWYRYEFNGTDAYDVTEKDYIAARAAKNLYDSLVQVSEAK